MATKECADLATAIFAAQSALASKQAADKRELASVMSQINDLLHIVEYLRLPASDMSKVSKKLRELYQARRTLKEDIIVADNILQHKKDPLAELTSSVARNERYEKEAQASFDKFFKSSLFTNPSSL